MRLAILLNMFATCLITRSLSSIRASSSLYSSAVAHSWKQFVFLESIFLFEMFHLICGDVVIILKSFLITFHSNGVFLPAVPPVGYSHSALTHFTSLKENVRIKFRVFLLNFVLYLSPGHVTDFLLLFKMQKSKQVCDSRFWRNIWLATKISIG